MGMRCTLNVSCDMSKDSLMQAEAATHHERAVASDHLPTLPGKLTILA